jgi:Questin oxidase-like
MATPTDVLDGAFDRLGQWGFDDPHGYVNHGPMACEALDALGRPAEVDSWSRLDSGTPPTTPVEPRRFVWKEALGDATRAGEWMGYFERAISDDGWAPVLDEWLPRLLPGMGVALFHGAIRCAHAVRAIETADTPARRAELVRSLGYWAALFCRSYPPDLSAVRGVDDIELDVVLAAADAARHYVARPNIIHLHGVTAAMAVSILIQHTDEATAATALGHLEAEHAALYEHTNPIVAAGAPDIDEATLIDAAIASGEAHAVKLVEATRRGFAATDDPVFLAAAERVTRRGLRVLMRQDPSSATE